ncbi:MAG: hypothetical protein WAM64_10125 [Acidimicrobiales bacterium]
MKKITSKSLVAVALVAAMGVSIPAVAFADSTTSSTSVSASTNTTASINSVWHSFHLAWKAYGDQLRSINLSYHASVAASRSAYLLAKSTATTPAERQAARAAFIASLAADINARVAAITAAGDPPSPPAGYNDTAWVQGFQAANVAFRASATAAESAYAQAIASATAPWQLKSARLTFELAIGNAIVVRATALEALGPPPTNPGQPLA